MRFLKVILFTMALAGLAGIATPAADAAHFEGFQMTPTSCVYAGQLTIDGADAVDGADEVGVFVEDGAGGEILVGAGVMGDTLAGYYYVTAYGDDPETTEEQDGATGKPGEILIFKVWDSGSAQEYTISSGSMSYEAFAGLTQPVIPPVWTNGTSYGLLNLEVTTGTNQPPVVSDQGFSVDETSSNGTVVGTVTASDPDGDPLSYSITGGNTGNAFSLDITTGELWVNDATQLDHAIIPVYALTVEVQDGTATDTAQVTVNVNPAGGGSLHFSGVETTPTSCVYTGRAVIGGMDAVDSIDEVGVFVGDGAGGEILIGAATIGDVQLGYYYVTVYGDDTTTPEKNGASYNDVLTFKLWDASAGQEYLIDSQGMTYEAFAGLTQPSIPPVWTSGTTFGLLNLDTTAPVNHSPVIGDGSFSVSEDGVNGDVIGTVSASDADGDALHYAITAGNTDGVFTIHSHSGQITISDASRLDAVNTPTYTLTVRVDDTNQASDTATVTIDVVQSGSGSNPPIINDQTFYVHDESPNGTLVGTVTASDPDGDPLSYSITGGNADNAFSLDITTGELSVNDATQLDHATTPVYTLTVEVQDGTAADTAQVTVNVNPADGGSLHFSGVKTTPTSCVYTGRAVIAGMDAVDGIDEVGVFVNDGAGGEILIGAAVFGDVQLGYYYVTVYGDDTTTPEKDGASDNDPLTFKLWDASTSQEYLIDSQDMAYESFNGLTEPSIPPLWTSGTTFGLLNLDAMANGNQSPVVEDGSFTVREDGVNGDVVGTVSASDADGDVLHYAITAGNTDGVFAIDSQSGQITINDASRLDAVNTPTYTLTVEVDDGNQASDTAMVAIDVIQSGSGSNPPVVNNQTFYVYDDSPNGTLVGVVSANDPDGDPLLFTITAGDSNHAFIIDENTGNLMVHDRYQLNYYTTRVYNLIVEVSDGTLTDTATVTVNLRRRQTGGGSTNRAPSIQNQTFSIDAPIANGDIVGTVAASDSDSSILFFTITDGNGDGLFAIDRNTGRITIHDTTGLTAGNAYPLNVRVSDGQLSNIATVTITVNEAAGGGNQPPDAPIPQSPANGQTGVAGSPVLRTGPFTDPDGNDTHGATHWQVSRTEDFSTLVFEVISDTDLTSLNSPDLVLDAGAIYYWRAMFFDTAGTASPWSNIVMFETAPAANQPPIADAGPDQTARPGQTVTLDGSGSRDSDGAIASYSWRQVSGTAVGLSSNGANATFTAPETDADGEAFVFELVVTDTGNLQSVDTCIVNVSLDNSPPIADAGVDHTVTEGTTVILDASRSSDPDGEIASRAWTQVSGPEVTLSDPTAVNPTFVQPVPTDDTTFRFRLTVEDGGGLMSSDDVEVIILDNGITRYADDILSFTLVTGKQLGIQGDEGGRIISLDSVDPQSLGNTSNRPTGTLHGSIDTTIRADTLGGVVTVHIYLPEPADDDLSWFRYSDWEGWGDYTANVTYNAERNRVEMILADGGIEDADAAVNGFIRIRLIFTGGTDPAPDSPSYSGGGGGAGCYVQAGMARDASRLSASAMSAWLVFGGLVALGAFSTIRKKPAQKQVPDSRTAR